MNNDFLESYISFIGPIDKPNMDLLIANIEGRRNEGFELINLLISTSGGDPAMGIAGYNILRGFSHRLRFYNIGNVDSAGIPFFMSADQRIACPNSSFMIHELSWSFSQTSIHSSDVKVNLDNLKTSLKKMLGIVADRTSLDISGVTALAEEGAVLDPNAAEKCGFVQSIEDVVVPDGVDMLHVFPIQKV